MHTFYLLHDELGVCVFIKHFTVFCRLHITFSQSLVTHLYASYQICGQKAIGNSDFLFDMVLVVVVNI